MNKTNVEHALYALLMFLIAWAITLSPRAGAAFGIAFFLGREHAQAQNKYKLGDFAAFDMRRWSTDARLDLLFPIVACLAATFLAELLVPKWI